MTRVPVSQNHREFLRAAEDTLAPCHLPWNEGCEGRA
jgi:hypothetical protein